MTLDAAGAGLNGDLQLVRRVAAGDPRALGDLCDRHGATAYALACAMTAVSSVAEVVVADAFAQLWREASTFDSQRMSVFAWLMSIVRTRALAARPDDMVMPRVLSDQPRAVDIADRAAADSNAAMQGAKMLEGLPARVVEMAYFGGMSKGQIATELQLTERAVARLLREGVEALQASRPRDNVRASSATAALGALRAFPDSRR